MAPPLCDAEQRHEELPPCPIVTHPSDCVDSATDGVACRLLSAEQTLLADGGCVLGATMPHVVVDGQSMYAVLEAIAAAYSELAGGGSGEGVAHPVPVSHDRAAFLRGAPENLEAWEPDQYFGTPPAPPPPSNAMERKVRGGLALSLTCWAATCSKHVSKHDSACPLLRFQRSSRL